MRSYDVKRGHMTPSLFGCWRKFLPHKTLKFDIKNCSGYREIAVSLAGHFFLSHSVHVLSTLTKRNARINNSVWRKVKRGAGEVSGKYICRNTSPAPTKYLNTLLRRRRSLGSIKNTFPAPDKYLYTFFRRRGSAYMCMYLCGAGEAGEAGEVFIYTACFVQ